MLRTSRLLTCLTTAAAVGTTLIVGSTSTAAAQDAPGLAHYGANVHLLWSDNTQANVDRELDMLVAANANSARVDVAWSSLQTDGPGTINSSYRDRIDALVDGASRRGIGLVLALNTTPCWASVAPADLKLDCTGAYWDRGVTRYPPADVADFAWAARWVAERYGSRVAALELWNEPNYDDAFTNLTTPDKPGVYTAMVKAAYPAVKSVAPQLPVLAGSMAFADADFLRELYARGIQGSYDGISVHPYNEWRAPGAPHDPLWAKYDYVLGLEAVRAVMTAAGDSSPVWVTEVGWTNCTLGADRWCVTAQQQADFTAQLVALTAERFPWVRALLVYGLRDKGRDASYTEDNFGLVTRDYAPKPALAALGGAFAALRASAPAVPPPPAPPAPAPTLPAPTPPDPTPPDPTLPEPVLPAPTPETPDTCTPVSSTSLIGLCAAVVFDRA